MEAKTFKLKGLVSYFRHVIEKRTEAKLNCFNYGISLKHLESFTNDEVLFKTISKQWFQDLKEYLTKSAKGLRCDKKLSQNSVNSYFSIIISVAREAANEGYIDHNVVNTIINTGPRQQGTTSVLSFDEIQKLANTPCHPLDLKKAFLFSCLTGLQWKEIDKLKWRQIVLNDQDEWQIIFGTGKTQCSIPISIQARQIIGLGGRPDVKVFALHYSAALCVNLNKWALRAGITRSISFQTARQSFGKMLRNEGIDLELISELLGHKQIKTTARFLSTQITKAAVTSNYLRTFNV